MTVPQVIYTPQAHADLGEIRRYIAANDGKERAKLIIHRLIAAAHNLAYMPGMGRSRPYLDSTIRAFTVSPWSIIYEPLHGLDGILIHRVLDGRRDLPKHFGQRR